MPKKDQREVNGASLQAYQQALPIRLRVGWKGRSGAVAWPGFFGLLHRLRARWEDCTALRVTLHHRSEQGGDTEQLVQPC